MLFSRLWPLFTAGFFVVAGYEFLRSPSVSLFQAHYSPSATPYLMVILPVFSFILFYIYGRILTRMGPRKTFTICSVFSAAVIVLLERTISSGGHWATGVLFLFREAYIVMILEQMWAFLDSVINEKEARTVNAWFTTLTSVGSVSAGFSVGALAVKWGTLAMLNLGAITFLPAVYFMNLCYRKNERRIEVSEVGEETVSHTTGFQYFSKYAVLRYLFFIAFSAQMVSTAVGLNFQERLYEAFPSMDLQTSYSGTFYAVMNILSMFFQLLLAPYLLARISVAYVQLLVPLVQVGLGAWVWFQPSLTTAGVAFIIFKAMDYSLYRSSKEIIFIQLPYDARYRTKGWIDVIGYRTSKGLGAVGFSILEYSGMALSGWYSGVALAATAVWTGFAYQLTKAKESK